MFQTTLIKNEKILLRLQKSFIPLVLLSSMVIGSACSVGVGNGEISGYVTIESCNLEEEPFHMNPDYFAADPAMKGLMSITVQQGSDFGENSNGLAVEILDVNQIKLDWLNQPIQIEDQDELLEASVYLNNFCNAEHFVVMRAVEGTFVVQSIYAPEINEEEKEIRISFFNVVFEGSTDKEVQQAVLSGHFNFIFSRGRPLQRFP